MYFSPCLGPKQAKLCSRRRPPFGKDSDRFPDSLDGNSHFDGLGHFWCSNLHYVTLTMQFSQSLSMIRANSEPYGRRPSGHKMNPVKRFRVLTSRCEKLLFLHFSAPLVLKPALCDAHSALFTMSRPKTSKTSFVSPTAVGTENDHVSRCFPTSLGETLIFHGFFGTSDAQICIVRPSQCNFRKTSA